MNNQLSLHDIKHRLVTSFMSLTLRQIILRAIGFVSINIILAKVLPIATLGIFNIATSITSFFAFFSDIGLAASLIQKKESIGLKDIQTTFTIQQILVGFLSLVIIFGAPFFGKIYQLDTSGIWLVRVLGITFFLSSLKVIPSVMLERELRFQPLVNVELLETIVFNIVLIILVYQNFGVWSFSIATLLRSLSGLTLIYLIVPVKIKIGIDKISALKLLSFGVPYQLNSLLALLKDRLIPLVIAKMVGPVGVGYITWSQAMAYLPLEVMNVMIRITFPAFSRLQEEKEALAKAIEKSLLATSLAVYPCIFGLAAIMPSVVEHVVSQKWQPALNSFYLFEFSAFWAVISTTFTNALNAIGHIKTTLKLMVFWTIITWFLSPMLTFYFGFNGVAISSFLISFTSMITIILLKRVVKINVMQTIWLPVLASGIMGGIVFWFAELLVKDKTSLILSILLGALLYGTLVVLLGGKGLLTDLKKLRNA